LQVICQQSLLKGKPKARIKLAFFRHKNADLARDFCTGFSAKGVSGANFGI